MRRREAESHRGAGDGGVSAGARAAPGGADPRGDASERDRLAVSILAYAGLRPSELVALTWQAVPDHVIVVERNYSYGQLRPAKTATALRTVEIVEPLRDDLDAFRPARPELGARDPQRARRVHRLAWVAAPLLVCGV